MTQRKLFGSLNNRLMENAKPPVPTVGMGATICYYTDRRACTVIEVHSERVIVIQEDKATRTDGNPVQCESQTYSYAPNPAGTKHVVSLRKDGRWRVRKGETGVMLGHRDEHYDYNF